MTYISLLCFTVIMFHVDKSCKYYIKAIIRCTAYGCIAMEQHWM